MTKTTKSILGATLILATFGITLAGNFYYKNLRGVGPALSPVASPEIITGLTATSTKTGSPLTIPSNFTINIFATGLGSPRELEVGPDGNIWASIPKQGKIISLRDENNDGVADKVVTIVSGLNLPHGFAWHCLGAKTCNLYVAETNQVVYFNFNLDTLAVTNKRVLLTLPSGKGHNTRTLMFVPESSDTVPTKLLVAIGSSCNVCHEKNALHASVQVIDLVTNQVRPFATGLRNAVFMTARPNTDQIWATEMGRDLLGDDTPPDEINILEEGKNYGWPICYGKNIHDTNFDKNTYIRNPCMEPFETESFVDLQAHSAPLGLAFTPSSWPEAYHNNLLVAYHGSWNRSVPTGYKIVRIVLDKNGKYQKTEDFISGWLVDNKAVGRPVDLLIHNNTLYISDDLAGVVYRLTTQSP